MNINVPFQFNGSGCTAQCSDDDHIRDLIEAVLFTAPGERINRPNFGSGLMQLVFEPVSAELTAATRMLVESTLQQWLGDLIQVEALNVNSQDSSLLVTVRYVVRRTQQRQVAQFQRDGVL
jgi:phage baseplate assembly protein W